MTKHAENIVISASNDENWAFLPKAAAALGFVAVGTTPAGPIPASAARSLAKWLHQGMHAGLNFMQRTQSQREDPHHPGILPDADVVIVAALPYGDGTMTGHIWNHVSRHARGVDYHITVKEKLRHLAAAVQSRFPACRCRIFSDSAPIAERTWAATAGIGSIGKSGALLVPKFGPKVVLGELVASHVPLPTAPSVPNAPFSDCGPCTSCMDACPTGAIIAPGVVDSNRCLSYWTIERKDTPLPREIATRISSLFGCDTCTAICPRAIETISEISSLQSKDAPHRIELSSLVDDDTHMFKHYFDNSALSRAPWDNLRENAKLTLRALEQGIKSCV